MHNLTKMQGRQRGVPTDEIKVKFVCHCSSFQSSLNTQTKLTALIQQKSTDTQYEFNQLRNLLRNSKR
ncbi:hypothetical protein AC062_0042 [Pasteurellaceae bacterium NI1060]|nr:hypothetical protein AC062_0042 [Pasteurellaceae bacterium NI1060]